MTKAIISPNDGRKCSRGGKRQGKESWIQFLLVLKRKLCLFLSSISCDFIGIKKKVLQTLKKKTMSSLQMEKEKGWPPSSLLHEYKKRFQSMLHRFVDKNPWNSIYFFFTFSREGNRNLYVRYAWLLKIFNIYANLSDLWKIIFR